MAANEKPGDKPEEESTLARMGRSISGAVGDLVSGVGDALRRAPTIHIDVAETADTVVVKAEIPGVDRKDIDISLERNVLTIKGHKQQEFEESKDGSMIRERIFGAFVRQIPLLREVDEDAVKAEMKDGVITITMPKVAVQAPAAKKISIN